MKASVRSLVAGFEAINIRIRSGVRLHGSHMRSVDLCLGTIGEHRRFGNLKKVHVAETRTHQPVEGLA